MTHLEQFQTMVSTDLAIWLDQNTKEPCDYCSLKNTEECDSLKKCVIHITKWLHQEV